MYARVHAIGDESLDLHALPGQGVLVVPITVIRGDASNVRKGGGGLILHGVFDSREDVAPGKFTLSQGFVQLSQMKLSRVGRERRDESSEGSINSRVVFCHDELVRDAKNVAEVVDHGGHQGAVHDATGDESRERDAQRRAEAQSAAGDARGGLPPGVVRQVLPLSEALTEARSCPSKATSRSLSSMSPLMRIWYVSLETSAHFLVRTISVGSVINAANRRAHHRRHALSPMRVH